MTLPGWITLGLSVSTVLLLLAYCLFKVFTLPNLDVEESLHGPGNIDTEDTKDAD